MSPGRSISASATALERAIGRGEFAAGETLPTERELAESLAVSRTTVAAAYRRLKDRGVLESRQGRGTWVSAPQGPPRAEPADRFAPEIFAGMLEPFTDVIDLGPACPSAASIVTDHLREIDGERFAAAVQGNGYQPGGLPRLAEGIAELLSARGLSTSPDEILITNGAQQAIVLLGRLFAPRSEAVAVEEPTYAGFPIAGINRRIGIAMDAQGAIPAALEEVLATTRPAFAYLIPTHQNPTGTVMPPGRREEIAALAERYRVPLIEDEVMRDLSLDGRPAPPSIASLNRDAPVISVGSVNKVLWGGLRVGWVRAERAVIARLAQLKTIADVGSPILNQWLVAEMLPHLDEAADEKRRQLAARYEVAAEAISREIPEWSWQRPRGGPAFWVRAPGCDTRVFAQVAARYGVNVLPGSVMASDEDGLAEWLRIPHVLDGPTMRRAAARLGRAWRALRDGRPEPRAPQPTVCV